MKYLTYRILSLAKKMYLSNTLVLYFTKPSRVYIRLFPTQHRVGFAGSVSACGALGLVCTGPALCTAELEIRDS